MGAADRVAWVALLAWAGCAGAPGPRPEERAAPPSPAPAVTWGWVDGAATSSTPDGTAERPFRSLQDALAQGPGRAWRVRAGLYPGPFVVPAGVRLRGEGAVVLHAEAGTAVLLSEGARLEALQVQGGALGVELRDGASLQDVALSGQRQTALVVSRGRAALTGVRLEATVSETVGARVGAGAALFATDLRLQGPFRRGVEVRAGGVFEVERLQSRGAVCAVHVVDGEARVRHGEVEGGRGPGLFVAGGALEVRDVHVRGHEYGLQAARGARLTGGELSSVGAELAGLTALTARVSLEDVWVRQSGAMPAVMLLESDATLARVRVFGARGGGLLVRLGTARLTDVVVGEVSGATAGEGDGLSVRGGRAELTSVRVRGAAGACVVATAYAEVRLAQAELERCAFGGLVVERDAKVTARGLWVRQVGSAAVVVPGRASLEVRGFDAQDNRDGPVWAECADGAEVHLRNFRGDAPLPPSPCIQRAPEP